MEMNIDYSWTSLSTTATLGTEESGHCRTVLNRSQCMDFLFARTKKSYHCREAPLAEVRMYYTKSFNISNWNSKFISS